LHNPRGKMTTLNTPPKPGRLVSRRIFLTLIQTASRIGQYRFAHQTALSWITTFPGDLPITLLLGEALYKDKRPDLAMPILERLCQTDPEFRDAVELRLEAETSVQNMGTAVVNKPEQKGLSANKPSELHQWALALGSRSNKIAKGVDQAPSWGEALYLVRKSIPGQDAVADMDALIKAELEVHQVLAINPETPLAAVTHLEILRSKVNEGIAPVEALRSLSEYYLTRFPNCLQCRLLLADSLIYGGDPEKAVALLHRVASNDVTGQVIRRILGENHPYRTLWPTDLEAALDIPIPTAVASVLGWNQLVMGEPVEGQTAPIVSSSTDTEPVISESVTEETVNSEPINDKPVFLNELEAVEVSSVADQKKQTDVDLDHIEIVTPVNESSKSVTPGRVSKDAGIVEPFVETKPTSSAVETENVVECAEDTPSLELPESLKSVQAELEKIGALIKQPAITRMDGRYPVYVILTSKEKLVEQFGVNSTKQIEAAMQELIKSIEINKRWKGLILYADQGTCLPEQFSTFKFSQAKSTDPWSIKLALVDLDSTLKKHGMMIGSVLIVGGSDIVPFHHLPNPTDDSDEDVPSDNPYGTRDQNYFLPEWPVGRLPGGIGDSERRTRFIVQTLKIYADRHTRATVATTNQPVLVHWVKSLSNLVLGAIPAWIYPRIKPQAFGYSAAAWKKASFQVFKTIGPSKMVSISPPTQSKANTDSEVMSGAKGETKKSPSMRGKLNPLLKKSLNNIRIPEVAFGYYNLHGVADAMDWYGQGENAPKGPVNPSDDQNYPVALRPQDISPNGKAVHQVVFSEACYGADHVNKSDVDSISFKFLLSGCQAFVGSTCTSYGSIDHSLEAADLLAQGFWTGIQRGLTAGEALRRSKVSLARDVNLRQGYLGGEDQKTLISFILYGDPLAQPVKTTQYPKAMTRTIKPPQTVKTTCEHGEDCTEPVVISAETFRYVRNLVAQYLPGMRDASLKIKKEKMVCETACKRCQNAQMGGISAKAMSPRLESKPSEQPTPKHQVVILSKQISGNDHVHRQIARLTLDEKGQMVKLVVSR
jgi:hypothetical protein